MQEKTEAMGENAKSPSNAPDQPEQFFKGSKFQLPKFVGSDSITMKKKKTFLTWHVRVLDQILHEVLNHTKIQNCLR